MQKFFSFLTILISLFGITPLKSQNSSSLGFPCYNNQYKLELTTTQTKISTCKDTIQLSVSYVGNPEIYWTDGYYGKSRVVSAKGTYQAYAYDSLYFCADTTSKIQVELGDAYISVYSQTGTNPIKLCEGTSTYLYAYATGPVKWNNGDTTNTILVTGSGKFWATTKSSSGCVDTSTILEVIVSKPNKLTIKSNSDTVVCLGDSVELELTTKYGYYNSFWSPFYSTTKKVKIGSSSPISVFALDSATGCGVVSNIINVKILTPTIEPLCMVTVDSATGKNKLVWSVTSGKRTAFYNIYRESNFAGEFDLIGDVDLNNAGMFLDTQVNPKQRPYTYFIEAVDSCNNRDMYSKYYAHTTLHLTANLGVNGENNLNWSDYIGIFPLNTYVIYRSNNSGKFTPIASVASSVKSYSDLNPPTGKNRYYIGIKGKTSCDTVGNTLINSNMVAFGILGVENDMSIFSTISPNPCSDFLDVNLSISGKNKLMICDLQGKIIKEFTIDGGQKTRVLTHDLTPGVYLLCDTKGIVTKFIKQ